MTRFIRMTPCITPFKVRSERIVKTLSTLHGLRPYCEERVLFLCGSPEGLAVLGLFDQTDAYVSIHILAEPVPDACFGRQE